jgi:hypothetical protein
MRSIFAIALCVLIGATAMAATKTKPAPAKKAADVITYFSCKVSEPASDKKGDASTVDVTVKFAIKNLDTANGKGDLVAYPGANEDEDGPIVVSPTERKSDKHNTMMSNLNAQGGDLRIQDSNIKLWGDGDGIEFTDLVVFDVDANGELTGKRDGYARDYGDAYAEGEETFKQFIKCEQSDKAL